MHPNPIFRRKPADKNLAFARNRGFGVVTITGEGGPLASHIPFIIEGTTIAAHMVRSNPIWKKLDEPHEALLVVSGADGYISPDWYGVDDQVPTWNYVAVHIRGVLRRLPDEALLPHLQALSAQFEARLPKSPWTIDKMNDEALAKLMRMIVPVEMSVESVDGTWKLSQNKSDEVRMAAADGLAGSDVGVELAELAALMRNPG